MPSRTQASSKNKGHRGVSYSEDELVEILEAAYREARYPIPKSEQIHRQYLLWQHPRVKDIKMFSDPIGETAPIKYARKTASTVLNKIESDFSITIPQEKRSVPRRIPADKWEKFRSVFFK